MEQDEEMTIEKVKGLEFRRPSLKMPFVEAASAKIIDMVARDTSIIYFCLLEMPAKGNNGHPDEMETP